MKKTILIITSLLTAGLGTGCSLRIQTDDAKSPALSPYTVTYYHDDKHRVTCWMTSYAMSCISDSAILNPGS